MIQKKKPLIFYGWIIVAISFITLTIAYSTRYSFSVFYVAILDEYGWTRAQTALTFSINMIIYAALSPVAGALLDRFGPRKVFPVAGAIMGLGMFLMSQVSAVWQLYLFFAIVAAGMVLLGYIPHACFIPEWFSLKLGTAIGIAVAGMALANVSSVPVQYLIDNVGWRKTYLFLAVVIAGIIIPITALFQRHRARDMGLPLDGVTSDEEKRGATEVGQGQEDPRILNRAWASIDWTLARAVKTKPFWFFFAQTFLQSIMVNIITVHSVAYIVDTGYTKMLAASVFALLGALAMVSFIGGIISDRIGREWAYTFGAIGVWTGIIILLLVRDTSSLWMLYLFAVLYGAGFGIDRPMLMSSQADVFKGRQLGRIMGFINLGYGIGGALGPWLAGYIFDVTGSYVVPYSIAILCSVVACGFLWLAAPRKIRAVGGKLRRQPRSTTI